MFTNFRYFKLKNQINFKVDTTVFTINAIICLILSNSQSLSQLNKTIHRKLWLLYHSKLKFAYPPASEVSRELPNLTERKNLHTLVYGVKEFDCRSVCLWQILTSIIHLFNFLKKMYYCLLPTGTTRHSRTCPTELPQSSISVRWWSILLFSTKDVRRVPRWKPENGRVQ